jgi:tetratricopeptide (TPR) repeat protein
MMKGLRFRGFAIVLSASVVPGWIEFEAGAGRAFAAESSKPDFAKQLGEALGQGIANAIKLSELVTKATAANANDRPAEALALADEALKLDAGSEKALFERGRALRKLKRLDQAIAHFEKAVARYPKSVPLHYGLAMTYDDAQQPRKALGHYEALTKLAPKDPDWFSALGATYYEVGEPERAISELRKALALDPNHGTAHSSLGFILLKLGRAAEAAAIYESWVRADPTNERAKARLAEARQKEQNPAPAPASAGPTGATATSLAGAPAAGPATKLPATDSVAIVVPPIARPAVPAPPAEVGGKIAVVAAPTAAVPRPRPATPPGPDTTVRPKVEKLGGDAVAALRGLPEIAADGEKARFVGSGQPRVVGQRAVANGATGVQVEWNGADAEGRPMVLRAEVLFDPAGRVAGARSTGMVNPESLELEKLLEGWR